MSHLSVSDAAREIAAQEGCTVAPHLISNLFYRRQLDVERCPIVGRARMIPVDYIPVIVAELRRRGLLKEHLPGAILASLPRQRQRTIPDADDTLGDGP